jgi:hypothetical protein
MDEVTPEQPVLKDLRGKQVTRDSTRTALLGALIRTNPKVGYFHEGAASSKRDIIKEFAKLGVTIE